MRKLLLFFTLLSFSFSFSQTTDLPKNPKKGECFVRCNNAKDEATEWKKVNCKIAKDLTSKEEIIKIQYKLINLGYKVEVTGFLDDETIDSYIHFKKNEKKIKRKARRKKEKK